MSSQTDIASIMIAGLYLLSAVSLLTVGIPQAYIYARLGLGFFDLQVFRLKTGLLSISFALFLMWRAVVYTDYAFFDQRIMGTLGIRWPIEMLIASLVAIASLYTAGLYLYYRRRHPSQEAPE